jgi:signal transduction histidine kinase
MAQQSAMQDALRIFRVLLVAQLCLLGMSFLAHVGLRGAEGDWLLLRALPTLLLAVLFLPSWLEDIMGRYFLAAGLSISVFLMSLEAAAAAHFLPAAAGLAATGLPPLLITVLTNAPPIEPFFFLLVPLVLFAWAYGRRGALWGSTLAAILYLVAGFILAPARPGRIALVLVPAIARIAILYLVPFIVSVLAERQRSQHQRLEAAHHRLQRHAVTVEQLAISRERNRMAQDLHDTLAHTLAALTVQLEALRTLLTHDPNSALKMVDEVSELAKNGLEESREAIYALRAGPVESVGLSTALRDRVEALQARTGVAAELRVLGQARDLTAQEADVLFRVADEALTNVERHANAGRVIVRLDYASDETDLTVYDNGQGFEMGSVGPDAFGLIGMKERAASVGAQFAAKSLPGEGTEIVVSLPR